MTENLAPYLNAAIPTRDQIAKQLSTVYRSKVGVREHGFNSGADVEEFQKAVDGKARKEPYCLGFIQWGANKVCAIYGVKNPLWPTERCYTLWTNTPAKYRYSSAAFGRAFVQKVRGSSTDGHIGYDDGPGTISWPTVEANTNAGGSRDGDGVYASSRYATGTLTKTVLGHIDIAQMIVDAIIAKAGTGLPVQLPLPDLQRKVNVRADWSTSMDMIVMDMVTPEMLALSPKRMQRFMPDWVGYNAKKRTEFFADLLFALTRRESSHLAKMMFQEPKDMGIDKVTGLHVVSEGMGQLSYQDATRYPIQGFDWRADAEKFKADMALSHGQKQWLAKSDRTILDPVINVKAIMVIIAQLLHNYPNDEFADCLGRYWSVMKRYEKGTKTYKESFLAICKELKNKGYRT